MRRYPDVNRLPWVEDRAISGRVDREQRRCLRWANGRGFAAGGGRLGWRIVDGAENLLLGGFTLRGTFLFLLLARCAAGRLSGSACAKYGNQAKCEQFQGPTASH